MVVVIKKENMGLLMTRMVIYTCMITGNCATCDMLGFLIVESTPYEITSLKTQEIALVDSIASAYHVDARALLKDNNYFEVRTNWNKLYVERKRVVKSNGKLKYKRWRKY